MRRSRHALAEHEPLSAHAGGVDEALYVTVPAQDGELSRIWFSATVRMPKIRRHSGEWLMPMETIYFILYDRYEILSF
ncbi:MAG: hypothetical protein GY737_03795 [Desulfobacteraceae bacterium]|nr:hypothetical protein [Desulfobacteraceae bacterium]